MKNFAPIIMIIVLIGYFFLEFYTLKQKHKKELKTHHLIDSLKQEILIKDISLGRCEDMWEQISKKYPKDAEKIKHYVE